MQRARVGAANVSGIYTRVQARIAARELQTACALSEKWGVSKTFEIIWQRTVKGHFDELRQDEGLADTESYFRVTVFSVVTKLSPR